MQIPTVVPTATDESAHLDSGQRTNLIRMPKESAKQFSSAEIPKFDRLVSTATKEGLAIRADGDGPNRV